MYTCCLYTCTNMHIYICILYMYRSSGRAQLAVLVDGRGGGSGWARLCPGLGHLRRQPSGGNTLLRTVLNYTHAALRCAVPCPLCTPRALSNAPS